MLEEEIKKLTTAIYELNATLEAQGLTLKPADTPTEEPKHSGKSVKDVVEEAVGKKEEEPKRGRPKGSKNKPKEETPAEATEEAEPETPEEKKYTAAEVKQMALSISRADRSKQKEIKQILSDHGATVVADLSEEDTQKVAEIFKNIAEELGA